MQLEAGESEPRVGSAGDFNGDGRDDLLVSTPSGGGGADPAVSAYIVLGGDVTGGDVSELGSDRAVRIIGPDGTWGAAGAGDVNGDGLADVVLGAPGRASAWVVYGKRDGADVDLDALGASEGFTILGTHPSSAAGHDVDAAGDFNDDGYDDVLIGEPSNGVGGEWAGAAFVVFGGTDGHDVELDDIGDHGIRILGSNGPRGFGDSLGWRVAGPGDVNGDGRDDVMVQVEATGPMASQSAFVVYGSPDPESFELASLGSGAGFRIDGWEMRNIDGAGDVNGDGFSDLLLTRWDEAAIVVNGSRNPTNVDSSKLAQGAGTTISDSDAAPQFARSAAGVGDVNGDGLDDVAVGSPYLGQNGLGGSGSTYVIYGQARMPTGIDVSGLRRWVGFRIDGGEEGAGFGSLVDGAGDLNGDGRDDVAATASGSEKAVDPTYSAWVVPGPARPYVDYGNVVRGRVGERLAVKPSHVERTGRAKYSAGRRLPKGLKLNPRTGKIRGVPRKAGTTNRRITIRDAGGTDWSDVRIVIRAPRKRG